MPANEDVPIQREDPVFGSHRLNGPTLKVKNSPSLLSHTPWWLQQREIKHDSEVADPGFS